MATSVVLSLVGVASAAAASPRRSQVAPFYKGKTITLVIGSSAGGGQDAQARVLAAYWGAFIPGHPTITVSDVPAGSGAVALTDVSQVFPANGLYVDLADGSVPLRKLFNFPGTDYPLLSMELVGAYSGSGPVVVRTAAGSSVTALKSRSTPVIAAAVSPGSLSTLELNFGLSLLGIPHRIVFGYKSNGPIALAFSAGSADVAATSSAGYLASFAPLGVSYKLYQIGYPGTGGNLVADKGAKAPTVEALYEQEYGGKKPSGGLWQGIQMLAKIDALSEQLFVREGTPTAARTALREGFINLEKSKKFRAIAIKLLGGPLIGPSVAEGHKELVSIMHSSSSIVQLLKSYSGESS